jgi:hypothetical protein
MKADSAWNMFVFRDGRRTVPGATLARALRDALVALGRFQNADRENALTNALLLAGELECALTDEGSFEAAKAAHITDSLAASLIACDGLHGQHESGSTNPPNSPPAELVSYLPSDPPAELKVSPPEGFAYYALHPLDFADLATNVSLQSRTVGVIGIRSIGVTLSSLVSAAVRRRGLETERFSVRPFGHPYDRQTEFNGEQRRRIEELRRSDAEFLVVDEGPGMSGSSFLSVGDALGALGVETGRITFLGSRVPDPDALRATDAGQRWRKFRSCYARQNSRLPQAAEIYVGGGNWRQHMLGGNFNWPASWTQMERLKFLSPDRRELFKFEGFGRFGHVVHERARQVAAGGFGPMPREFTLGFSIYPVVAGTPMRAADLTPALVDRMAEYCAFRFQEFRTTQPQNAVDLETMVRFNIAEEFEYELAIEPGGLFSSSPVIVDGRMLPHEWVQTPAGEYQKVDAASHGDDHFFPGPTDIAWDLAGVIVEWGMTNQVRDRFLDRYRKISADDPRGRLPMFLLAYAVFRCGYCLMAAGAMSGSGEEDRLMAEHDRYRGFVESSLPEMLAA